MLLKTIVADVRSNVDATRRAGLGYWARVIGKMLITPTVHVVLLFRISTALYKFPPTRPFAFIVRSMAVVWGGTEIHPGADIGPGLCLIHSQKVLIGEGVKIGRDARISHGVSIGGDTGRGAAGLVGWPVIGDYVTIGLDSFILGNVTIGNGAVISAQAFVVRDVPENGVAAGSPARVIRILDAPDA